MFLKRVTETVTKIHLSAFKAQILVKLERGKVFTHWLENGGWHLQFFYAYIQPDNMCYNAKTSYICVPFQF